MYEWATTGARRLGPRIYANHASNSHDAWLHACRRTGGERRLPLPADRMTLLSIRQPMATRIWYSYSKRYAARIGLLLSVLVLSLSAACSCSPRIRTPFSIPRFFWAKMGLFGLLLTQRCQLLLRTERQAESGQPREDVGPVDRNIHRQHCALVSYHPRRERRFQILGTASTI